MDLVEPNGPGPDGLLERLPMGQDPRRIIAHMAAQVKALKVGAPGIGVSAIGAFSAASHDRLDQLTAQPPGGEGRPNAGGPALNRRNGFGHGQSDRPGPAEWRP